MPSRVLRDTICVSESIEEVECQDPMAEVLFYRLIVQADDYGRFDARPAVIRAKCFTMAVDRIALSAVSKWLQLLAKAEMVQLYTVAGRDYLALINWAKYQRVRAERSKYPEPPGLSLTCGQMPADDSKPPQVADIRGHLRLARLRIVNDNDNDNVNGNRKRESRTTTTTTTTPLPPTRNESSLSSDVIRVYEKEIGQATPIILDGIREMLEGDHPVAAEWVCDAIREASKSNHRSWKYVCGILENWVTKGRGPPGKHGNLAAPVATESGAMPGHTLENTIDIARALPGETLKANISLARWHLEKAGIKWQTAEGGNEGDVK